MKYRIVNDLQKMKSYWIFKNWFKKKIEIHILNIIWRIRNFSIKIVNPFTLFSVGLILFIYIVSWMNDFSIEKNIPFLTFAENIDLPAVFGVLLGFAGIFLGLFYAAVASSGSEYFMKAPANLQKLFIQGKIGSRYIYSLTFGTLLSLFYFIAPLFGYNVPILGVISLGLLLSYSAISFLRIGPKNLYFINPREVTVQLVNKIIRSARLARSGNIGDRFPEYQNACAKRANINLVDLKTIVEFSQQTLKVSSSQLLDISSYIIQLLVKYLSTVKKEIPRKSYWHQFQKKRIYPNWIVDSDLSSEVYTDNGMSLPPKDEEDFFWLENQLLTILLDIFSKFVSDKNWSEASRFLEMLSSGCQVIGRELEVELVENIFSKFDLTIESSLNNAGEFCENQEYLAYVERIALLRSSSVWGLQESIKYYPINKLEESFSTINWKKIKTIYTCFAPIATMSSKEKLFSKIKTEVLIHHHIISPLWYRNDVLMNDYARHLKEYYLFTKNQNYYFQKTSKKLSQTNVHASAIFSSKWIEFSHKLEIFGKETIGIINYSKKFDHGVFRTWPEFNFKSERAALEGCVLKSIESLTDLIPNLITAKQSITGEIPDFLGQAYSYGLEEVYKACKDNNPKRIEKLFDTIFHAAKVLQDNLIIKAEKEKWNQQAIVRWSTEPLMDIIELSGFVKFYSELYNNSDLWEPVSQSWIAYLEGNAVSETELLNEIFKLIKFHLADFGLGRHSRLSEKWKISLSTVIKQKYAKEMIVKQIKGTFFSIKISPHKSSLARYIIQKNEQNDFGLRVSGKDIFIASFLSKRLAANDMEIPDRYGIINELRKEEEHEK